MGRRLVITVLVGAALLLSAVAVAASDASAPTAITGPVTALGTTTATVTGTVNPGGLTTSRYFEYGTTTNYGSKTASVGIGSGTANVDVSAALTSLLPGTTYHYRVVATNSTGTSRGADGIFTTPIRNVTTTPPDRVREFSFEGSGGSYAALFDGSQQVLSWDNILWINRSVFQP